MAEFQAKLDTRKYPCEARMNCWLRRGREWCGICQKGDHKAWRTRCDAERAAMGFPTWEQVLVAAQKAFQGAK